MATMIPIPKVNRLTSDSDFRHSYYNFAKAKFLKKVISKQTSDHIKTFDIFHSCQSQFRSDITALLMFVDIKDVLIIAGDENLHSILVVIFNILKKYCEFARNNPLRF